MRRPRALHAAARIAAGVSIVLHARSASADNALVSFGDAGQLVVGLDRLVPLMDVSSWSAPRTSDAPTGTTLSYGNAIGQGAYQLPRLGVDWAPLRHFTLGADLAGFGTFGGSPLPGDSPAVSLIGIVPRAGYLASIVGPVGIWLRLGAAYYVLGEKGAAAGATCSGGSCAWSFTWRQLDVDTEALIVVTPFAHTAVTTGIVAELPLVGQFDEERSGGQPTTRGGASWLHIGIVGGLVTYL